MIEELDNALEFIEKNEAILFIGAGISKIVGCYNWHDVVKKLAEHELIKELFKNKIPKDFSKDEIIRFCKECLEEKNKEDEFWGIIREAIMYDHEKFRNIYIPFIKAVKKIRQISTIITTNIDGCLEDTRQFGLDKIYYEIAKFNIDKLQNGGGIFHIHGYKDNIKNALWTERDYPRHYNDNNFKEFMKNIFTNYSVIFLGSSLELSLKNIIRESRNDKIEHYALISDDNDDYNDADLYVYKKDYRLNFIKYGQRNEFAKIFSGWIDKKFPLIPSAEIQKDDGSVAKNEMGSI